MLIFMNVNSNIIYQANEYIKIEIWAIFVSTISKFFILLFLIKNKTIWIFSISIIQLITTIVVDLFFISNFSFSLKLGINGIAYGNILINSIVTLCSFILLSTIKGVFQKINIGSFVFLKEYFKIGFMSGVETFVRNAAFTYMVLGMMNKINDQGIYWVANNFIWSWLLLPILSMGNVIKATIDSEEKILPSLKIYLFLTSIIILIWIITIPTYKIFIQNAMNQKNDLDKIFSIIMTLFVFYVLFAFNNIFDSIIYATGKTSLILWQSLIVNILVYGIYFVLYILNIWEPTLTSIALMFGLGLAFDSIITFIIFWLVYYKKINFKNIIKKNK